MSRSFAGLRGSFRLGGVLIGAEPNGGGPLDYRDLVWTREGAQFSLALIGRNEARQELGSFSGSIIQQALAYAADGRPTTVTMTSGDLMPMLRVQVHPALVNSEIGCWFVDLDRFVDEATGDWDQRELWESRVRGQIEAYREAYELAASGGSAGSRHRLLATTPAFVIGELFPPGWQLADPAQSLFAHYGDRFDLGLIRQMIECQRVGDDGEAYRRCIGAYLIDTARYRDQLGTVWSGVREREFALTPAAFLPQAQPPLRFMLQTAFAEQHGCVGGDCQRQEAVPPWEFPMLADGIERRVHHFVRQSAEREALLARTSAFTLLQRLFRVALRGDLGAHFPRPRLVTLMLETKAADPIRARLTPQWSRGRQEAERFRQSVAEALAAGESDPRIQQAAAFVDALLAPDVQSRFAGPETCRGS